MKQIVRLSILFILAVGLTLPVFAASKSKSKTTTMYVTVDSAQLKAKPAASSKKIALNGAF